MMSVQQYRWYSGAFKISLLHTSVQRVMPGWYQSLRRHACTNPHGGTKLKIPGGFCPPFWGPLHPFFHFLGPGERSPNSPEWCYYYSYIYIYIFHRSLSLSPDNRMWNMSKTYKSIQDTKLLQCKNLNSHISQQYISPVHAKNSSTE